MRAGRLDEDGHAFFRQGLENRPRGNVQAYPLAVNDRISTNGLYLAEKDGDRTALYLPGQAEPFRLFANRKALDAWIVQQAKDGTWADRFATTHFSATDARGLDGDPGVAQFLSKDLHRSTPLFGGGRIYPKALSATSRIEGDPFAYLSRTRQDKDLEDATWLVSGNGQYKDEKIVRMLEPIPVAGSVAQIYLGRGSERRDGIGRTVDDVFNLASIVVPERLAAREAGQAAAAVDTAIGADEQLVGSVARGSDTSVTLDSANMPGNAGVDYRARPAMDDGISLAGRTANANGVYSIAGRQYIELDGHAARIQGLADQGRRAILADRNGQALHGVHVWRGDLAWQVGSLRGGAPIGFGAKIKAALLPRRNLSPIPGSPAIQVGGPETRYGMRLTAQERQVFWDGGNVDNRALATEIIARADLKAQSLLDDARAYFSTLRGKTETMFELPQGSMPNRLVSSAPSAAPLWRSSADDRQILQAVYRQHDGFVIGETHTEEVARRFLMDNMGALRDNGVKTIYLELCDDVLGQDIEKFNRGEPMSAQLRHYLTTSVRRPINPSYGDEQFFLQARKHGITIKPIDTYAATRAEVNAADDRLKAMNYYSFRKITHDQVAHPGKWVALVGSAHLDKTSTQGVVSLGGLLNVPSMKIGQLPPQGNVDRMFITDYGDQLNVSPGVIYRRTSDWRLMVRPPR